MSTQDDQPDRIVRTTITLPERVDQEIRDLAERHDRPLSREIRRALEAHIEAERKAAA